LTVADGVKTAALPADLTVQADTPVGRILVEIPAGTVISATDYWTGAVNIPSVRPNDSVTVTPDAGKTAEVNSVIEVGFDDLPLTFSKAVRLVFTGQAGKDAGYYRGGVFTKITAVMSSDSQAEGDALPAGGDAKIAVGQQDLVVWTKHFTRFITYTQTDTSSSGGGGGGSGSVTVYMRVEGYNDTLVPRTSVSVDNFDLTPYLRPASGSSASASSGWGPDKLPKPTVAHALVSVLQSRGLTFDLQDYGWSLYAAMIAGEREFDIRNTSGWLYRVNYTLPNIGCQAYNLKNGDDIVWYFAAYGFDTWYSRLAADKTSARTGEEITLTLVGAKTDLSGSSGSGPTSGTKLKGATIYVNGEEYKPEGTTIATDENGQATIKFNSAGKYSVSAERFTGQGIRDIVRPLPVVITVSGASIGGVGGGVPMPEKTEDAAGVLSDALNSANPTETQVSETVKAAAASLAVGLEKVKTAEEAGQLLVDTSAVTGLLGQAAGHITSQTAADFAGSCLKVTGVLAGLAPQISGEEGRQTLAQAAVQAINAAAQVMSGITDKSRLAQTANNLLDTAAAIRGALAEEQAQAVEQSLANMVRRALPGLVKETLSQDSLKQEGEALRAVISSSQTAGLAGQTAQAVAGLEQKLLQLGLEQNRQLPRDIIFDIPSQGEKTVEVTLSPGALDSLATAGTGRMGVVTSAASFSFDPGSFGEAARQQGITLSAARLEGGQIPAGAAVPPGSVVIELTAKAGGQNIGVFNSPVEVSIPYPGTPQNAGAVTVFLLKDDGGVELVGGLYDPATRTVKFLTSHFSKYFAGESVKQFSDLAGYAWAKEAVETLAGKGVVSGKGESLFDPGAAVTRAEFAALVTMMLKYQASPGTGQPFQDVPETAWYHGAVAAAYTAGLISGRSTGQFDPEGSITRQEMAAIIAKALEKKGYLPAEAGQLDAFSDRGEIAGWAQAASAIAIREGIISGMGDGRFAPEEMATRAQAAVMLHRLYGRLLR
jgi:hypothetical protein